MLTAPCDESRTARCRAACHQPTAGPWKLSPGIAKRHNLGARSPEQRADSGAVVGKKALSGVPPVPSGGNRSAIGAHSLIGSRYGLLRMEESGHAPKSTQSGGTGRRRRCQSRLPISARASDRRRGQRAREDCKGRVAPLVGSEGQSGGSTIGDGLWRVQVVGREQPTVEKASLNTGLLSDSIQAITEDREGNIWIGTTGGLQRLTERTVTPVVTIGWVTALDAGAKTLWAGTSNGLFRLNSGSDRWRRELKQPADLWVRSAQRVDRGTLQVRRMPLLTSEWRAVSSPCPFQRACRSDR